MVPLAQNDDKILVERVQSAIYNAIPLWKNQIVIALGLTRQQNVLKMQQAISDTTNELLKRNAEMLKINSIETAKENNRSIVDIETVKKVNDDLVTTIEETLKIQQEGCQVCQSAEQELLQIENRLKVLVLQHVSVVDQGVHYGLDVLVAQPGLQLRLVLDDVDDLDHVGLVHDRAEGAGIRAGAAVDALLGVDLELAVSLKNSLCGAVFLAGAAGNAIITDNKCHGVTSL